MLERLKNGWVLGGLVLAVLTSAACVQLGPRVLPNLGAAGGSSAVDDALASTPDSGGAITSVQVSPNGASASTRSTNATRDAQPVRRGAISVTTALNGRVVGGDETTLSFAGAGHVHSVPVRVGDAVKEGDVLLEIDSQDIQRQLAATQAELETATIRLEQARAQASADTQARQGAAAQRAQDDEARRRASVADAEATLHRAQAELEKIKAGASPSDIRAAEAAVGAAQIVVQKAQADVDRLKQGADSATIRDAENGVAKAQSDVDRAQADLDRLTRGPDPDAVRSAQRAVERAQNQQKVAESVKVDPKDPKADQLRAEREANIASAKLDVQDAQDRLTALTQPPPQADVAIAKRTLQIAQDALKAAQERLATLKGGPDQALLDQAQAALDNANTVEANAEDRLAEVRSHPTPAELQAANDNVAAAQQALNRAAASGGGTDTSQASDAINANYNIVLLEKDVARDQASIAQLQDDLAATELRAPFDATITTVKVRAGDTVDHNDPVMVVSRRGDAIVRVESIDADTAKQLSVGQQASIKLGGSSGPEVQATLARITDPKPGSAGTAEFTVSWGSAQPVFGTAAQLQVIVNRKDGVLLIPRKALRTAGQRRYVQYLDGTSRKIANVEIGLQSSTDVEILSGLTEGQLVLLGP